jgi:hypothetical protein
MHQIHRRFPFFLNVRTVSTDTAVLLYYPVRMIVHMSPTLTLLQFTPFLPMCIEPTNTTVLILSHYSARTRFVTLTWHVLGYIMAATTLS